MKIYPFRAAAGFLTLFLSVVLLLTTSGAVSWSIWLFVWQFWPILFVIFGVAFLMRRWRFNFFLGMPIFMLIFAIMSLGLWLTWKDQYFGADNFAGENTKEVTETKVSNEMPKKTDKADVKIVFGASKIDLGALPDENTNFIYDGTHKSNFFSLNQRVETIGDKARLTFKSSPFIKRPFNSKSINDLGLGFSQKLEYSFDIQTNASDLDLNLEKLKVKSLDVDAGASNVTVRFGNIKSTDVKVKSGASSLKFYFSKSSGVKVMTKSSFTSRNFEEFGLKKKDRSWESDNYKSAESKVEIELESGISKVELISY